MDGEFACLDPYLGTNYHLLSDVKNSKLEIINSKFPQFRHKMKNQINKGVDYKVTNSNFYKFLENCKKFMPFLKNAKFVGSFKVIRTLSLNKESKNNDERLSYIKIHSNKIISILAGKWNTSIYIAKKIGKLLINKKILILGHTGFVGRELFKKLKSKKINFDCYSKSQIIFNNKILKKKTPNILNKLIKKNI